MDYAIANDLETMSRALLVGVTACSMLEVGEVRRCFGPWSARYCFDV